MHGGVRGRGSNPPTYSIKIESPEVDSSGLSIICLFKTAIDILNIYNDYIYTVKIIPINLLTGSS